MNIPEYSRRRKLAMLLAVALWCAAIGPFVVLLPRRAAK